MSAACGDNPPNPIAVDPTPSACIRQPGHAGLHRDSNGYRWRQGQVSTITGPGVVVPFRRP